MNDSTASGSTANGSTAAEVDHFQTRWGLSRDGLTITTPSSVLVPAFRGDQPVMLKIARVAEEQQGNAVMVWWAGHGAARVFEHDGPAILLKRATGLRSLVGFARAGGSSDDEATRILARAGMLLHERAQPSPPVVTELSSWFAELFTHAAEVGGFHARAAGTARDLLAHQQEVRVLHGDLHHGNVLDFGVQNLGVQSLGEHDPGDHGPSEHDGCGPISGTPPHPSTDGWLAIDPKGLRGDRAFDFANILCNPDAVVTARNGRLERQLGIICEETGIDAARLLRWTIAWSGLSTAWIARDPNAPERTVGITSLPTASSTLAVGLAAERLLGRLH